MHRFSGERGAGHKRVVMPLHHDEHVTSPVLGGHIPGLLRMAAAAADLQAATLAECVERETLVGPEQFAFGRLDRTWRRSDKALEEFPEGALADEADTGAAGLVEHCESSAPGTPA